MGRIAGVERLLVAFLGIGLSCLQVAHAEDAIATDRPDFVESSDVVGAGRFQIETGFQFERDRNRAADTLTRTRTTPTLLRIGVGDTWELRVETDGFISQTLRDLSTGTSTRTSGFSDVALGAKWHVQDGDAATGKPGVAWLFNLDVDSGSAAFRGNGLRPSLRGVAEWELPGDAGIGVMGGVLLDRNAANKRFSSGILAVTLGKSWTPVWRTFVELAGQSLASRGNGGSVVSFDAGVTYLVNNSLQFDFSVFRGLNHNTPRLQWGFGVSALF